MEVREAVGEADATALGPCVLGGGAGALEAFDGFEGVGGHGEEVHGDLRVGGGGAG